MGILASALREFTISGVAHDEMQRSGKLGFRLRRRTEDEVLPYLIEQAGGDGGLLVAGGDAVAFRPVANTPS
jgi:hypothetical protein